MFPLPLPLSRSLASTDSPYRYDGRDCYSLPRVFRSLEDCWDYARCSDATGGWSGALLVQVRSRSRARHEYARHTGAWTYSLALYR